MALIYAVEDDKNILEIEMFALKNSGYQVDGFECARDFYKKLDERQPDLVLLDIMLPDEDGLEIVGKLRRRPETKKLPVIMVTAKTTEIDKVKGLDVGADDYLTKPFGVMELIARVKAVLRRTMEELLYNLCDNAIRYNNRGGSVTVTVDEKDGHVFLSIRDTGIGIPTEHQDRVFERFYRVDKSRSKATGGTGLGLAIVKHIVAQHGASISLESQAGKGTEIRVEFSDALKQQMEERAENV